MHIPWVFEVTKFDYKTLKHTRTGTLYVAQI